MHPFIDEMPDRIWARASINMEDELLPYGEWHIEPEPRWIEYIRADMFDELKYLADTLASWNRCYPGNINVEYTVDEVINAVDRITKGDK